MRALLFWILSPLLAGCGRDVKPAMPGDPPVVVEVPVEVFVPIDAELTAKCQWRATAPLEEMPSVARERKGCLQQYEIQLDAISRVQGKPRPVPAIKPKPKK